MYGPGFQCWMGCD